MIYCMLISVVAASNVPVKLQQGRITLLPFLSGANDKYTL